MHYTIRHVTRFTYETPISESVMETRMQPRSEGSQRCLHFGLSTVPAARVLMYQDHEGNAVHHFNQPAKHSRLTVTAEALVDCGKPPALPEALDGSAWGTLDAMTGTGEFWDLLNPSTFALQSPLLDSFAVEIGCARKSDPLGTLRWLTTEMFERLEYSPQSTHVDSPIDDALRSRQGVCQDFAHVMIALVRQLGIPCRYVSGYLFREAGSADRSSDGATHAWIEALLPELGWVGFDPTNNLLAGERHVRVAVGRDYADVPPTRGVYKGLSAVKSELAVAVRIGSVRSTLASSDVLPFVPWMSRDAAAPISPAAADGSSQQ
jgi:transglutaminase-like putative cysteine protease